MTDKCKLLCEGIKDEQEAQKYYRELLNLEVFPKKVGTIVGVLKDELKHEDILNNIKKEVLPNCVCNEKVKILPSDEVSNLSKEERIKIAKRIWDI